MEIATTQNIQIRLAEDKDFEQILAIWLEGVGNSFDDKKFDMEIVKEKFAFNFFERRGIFNFWVAVDQNDKTLGWQSLIKTSSNPFRQNTLAESSTYIAKDTRFKGLGEILLDYVMQEAEKSELEYVIGFVSVSNKPARKITAQTGWVEIGIVPPSKKNSNKFEKIFMVRPV
ncbi:GNAT family N-acetyltransferase [Niabella drilacis]|uniref:L-amino acid N-acyltransferase YncA n=1 Tax=Niabella drilacis (strain DSM 25811 / CCM 8410 / CCUG 62505 / LMG 26954 / E90) TaxID=1285928 RepID=A0A1G7BWL3_NIADE|nr:GNAT family N-acetyltransferase [Niabella drilacis]SDE31392.1 L-amino acid N-acyltransferase YncA [Niabella drilacis]